MSFWREWKYKNLTAFVLSVILALLLAKNEVFHALLLNLGNFGYIGAFVAGILFVSTFTVAAGTVMLLVLAETLHPLGIGVVAGLGAVLGDFIIFNIFRFAKDNWLQEVIEPVAVHLNRNHHLQRLFHSKYFSWSLPVIGAIIIASPLPDEVGVTLMGISKMKTYQFLAVSFVLNAIGIFLVVSASLVIKP